MIHNSGDHSKFYESSTSVTIIHIICIARKLLNSRKFGNILRYCLLVLSLLILYITSSYILNNSSEENSIEEIGNETIFLESSIPFVPQLPTFKANKPVIPNEVVFLPPALKYGETLLNCGLPQPCEDGTFSIHIYTGKDHKDEPRLCVDSKYILSKDVNGAGRGINAVIVDNMTKTIIKVSHFDTYEKESTALETLLLTLRPGDIIIILTFDEPTRKLSRVAKLLLYELGSSLIQNLSYRGSWYFVTQKGISGFTPYEGLHIVESSGWPKHHDVRFCVPFQIKGQAVHPDPLPRLNPARQEFCDKYGNYPLFCDADVVNDPLISVSLLKHSRSVGRIYSAPIIVISGDNVLYLPIMLESLFKQSGINPSLVVVFYMPQNKQVPKLCDLFGFMSVELTLVYNYCERVKEAFETASLLFPDSREMVVLGENLVLSPDFLYFMGQALPLLQMDPMILSISAFNENGFQGTHDNLTLLYRVESFSGLAVVLRKDFFQRNLCGNESETDPLFISSKVRGDNIVPEVSRVLLIPQAASEEHNDTLWLPLLAQRRSVSYEDNVQLKGVEELTETIYSEHVAKLLSSAKSISYKSDSCGSQADTQCEAPFLFLANTNTTGETYALYVYQKDRNDFSGFHLLCQYFRLLHNPPYTPRGMYRGLLRFTWFGNNILAVGSTSPFYRSMPADIQPLRI